MKTTFTGLRWSWVFLAGTAVAALTIVLAYLIVYAYVSFLDILTRGEPDAAHLAAFYDRMGFWGMPLILMLLTFFAASWVARRAGERFAWYGILIGLVSVFVSQVVVYFAFPPVALEEIARFLGVAVAGGWLGGIRGRAALENQEALYRASRDIGAARDPRAIVSAIGEHLAGPEVGAVALWRTTGDETPEAFVPVAVWTPKAVEEWPSGSRLEADGIPALADSGRQSPVVLRDGELPPAVHGVWERRDVRSALLVLLVAPDEARVGLLMVAFRGRRRVSRGAARLYQTVGAQAALALENMRLMQEARRAGIIGERQRLAHEIHDTLAQGFNSIVMNLQTAERRLPPGSEPARHPLELARTTARESLAEARRLVWALRPEALDRHSLPEAIEMLTGRWSKESGISAGASVTGTPRQLPPEVEAALLRTAQEALSNVRKHAGASRVMLTLSYMDDVVVLDARDDGVGFDPGRKMSEVQDHSSGGFGLRAMRERIEQLGGTVQVESEPGEGTSLVIELPVTGERSERNLESAREAR